MISTDEYMSAPVITAKLDASVLSLSQLMDKHNIGSIVIVDGTSVAGIVTERDIMRRVVAKDLDLHETVAKSIMTDNVHCLGRDASLMEVAALMKEHNMRRIVVLDNDAPVGIITSRDLVGLLV